MSLLEELIGPGYENLSNEELDKMIMDGRIVREEAGIVRATRQKKAPAVKVYESKLDDEDLEDF